MNQIGFLAVLALFLAGACGKPGETTVVGPDGSRVTSSEDGTKFSGTDDKGNKVNWEASEKGGVSADVTSEDGKKSSIDMGGNTTVTEEDLGIPLYPGATKRDTDMDLKAKNGEGKETFSAMRFTTDDVKKVFAFYAALPQVKQKFESAETAVASGETEKLQFAVNMSKTEGGTSITITGTSK